MKIVKSIKLDRNNVEQIIKEAVEKETNCKVKSMRFVTSVDGDYDRGNAVQYIKNVYIEMM